MRWISGVLVIVLLLCAGKALAVGCSVRLIPVSFGDYDSSVASALNAEGDVYITCDPGAAYTIRLDAGGHSMGSFLPRRMSISGVSYTLGYNLYRDSARTEIWGDGTNNTYVQLGNGTGGEDHFIVYGWLPGGQNVVVGLYGDTVTATVEW